MANWLARIFGSRNQRLVSQYSGVVKKINAFEAVLQGLSDADLAAKTTQFREQLAAGKALDDVLPEAFAVVREAARRTLGMRHFDVQLIGGMVLHEGKIAEMRTGEGKTLVATLPGVPERAARQGRPRRHRQRLPRAAATPSGWGRSTASSA